MIAVVQLCAFVNVLTVPLKEDNHIWPFLTDLLSFAVIAVEAKRKQSSHPGSN